MVVVYSEKIVVAWTEAPVVVAVDFGRIAVALTEEQEAAASGKIDVASVEEQEVTVPRSAVDVDVDAHNYYYYYYRKEDLS